MIMKTINRINAFLLACAALFVVSCDDPNVTPTPNFPEKKEFIKNAGETVELSFDANLAWELSLSAPTSQFWFLEGGIKLTSWSGDAGQQNVTVHITDVASLETDYNCEVSMTMGGQTQVIATIKVVADQAYFKVYPAVWDEQTGYWKYDDNGVVYASEASSTLDMKFDQESMNYTIPAKVESNFVWSLPLSADAAWLDAVAEQKAGVNEVVFTAKPSAYPEGGATASVSIQKTGVAADAPETALTVKIGDYRSICVLGADTPIVFGSEGNYADEDITGYTLFAAEGVEVSFAEMMDVGGYDDNVLWLDYEMNPAEEQTLTGKIKEYELKIFVRANSGAQRTAELLVKTADKAESGFLSDDWSSPAEGVYSFAIEQDGAAGSMGGPLANVSGGVDALKEMTFELLPKSANKWYYDEFGTDYVYRLNTSKATASISFEEISDAYTYEISSVHNATAQRSTKDEWWVKYTAADGKLTLKLDPVTGNDWTEAEDDKYAENQAGDNFSKTNLKYEGAYLLVKNGDETVAVIDCVYDPSAVPVSDGLVDFEGEKPAASYVNKITVGDLSEELQDIVLGESLYTTAGRAITTGFAVYTVKVPKAAEVLTLKVLNEPTQGYFIAGSDWVDGFPVDEYKNVLAEDGVFSFTFNDTMAHETVFIVMKRTDNGLLCLTLVHIVKE